MQPITSNDPFFQAVILHLDMDAFFAAVEQADNPNLRGQPVIIGQSLRGVVAAASYEARIFGVHSAMPIAQARKLCPRAAYLPGRMDRYRQVSAQIMAIMRQLCPIIEQASIDEAYADISGTDRIYGHPRRLASLLKDTIISSTGLTCSIGIAPNKFLAKIASDWTKPDGLTVFSPHAVDGVLRSVPVDKIPGVGRQLHETLHSLDIKVIADVLRFPRDFWIQRLGKRGATLHDHAQGLDFSAVCPHRTPKSCSAENTFTADTLDPKELERWLLLQAERLGRELRQVNKKGLCVSIKLKFNDFSSITRSTTLDQPTNVTTEIFATARALLGAQTLTKPVRLIGTGVSQFRAAPPRLPLCVDKKNIRQTQVDILMDKIRDKFGMTSVARADASTLRKHLK